MLSAIRGSTCILAIYAAYKIRLARFSFELLSSRNKYGTDSSELEDSDTWRCTGAVRGLAAGTSALGGDGVGADIAGSAGATGPANGLTKWTFTVTLPGSVITAFVFPLDLPVLLLVQGCVCQTNLVSFVVWFHSRSS